MALAHETPDPSEPWTPEDTYGARLALIRQRMRWNVKEAATFCGINHQSWRNWESGGVPQDVYATSAKIAAAAGCSESWLVGGQNRKAMTAADLHLVHSTDLEDTRPGPGQQPLPFGPALRLVK